MAAPRGSNRTRKLASIDLQYKRTVPPNSSRGTVKLRPQVAEYADDEPAAQLSRIPIPSEIISHAVWLYYRFGLSFRDVEDLLAERGITVTYEAIGCGAGRSGSTTQGGCAAAGPPGRHLPGLDELFVKIQGQQQYLWRAVDEDGDVLDILVQSRRNRRAATRFFWKLLNAKARASPADHRQAAQLFGGHRTVMPSVIHSTQQYENNRAEVSHQSTRQRERQMRRFRSGAHLQRFASVHGVVQNPLPGRTSPAPGSSPPVS